MSLEPASQKRRSTDALPVAAPTRGVGTDVLLQAFHWNLVKTQGTGTVDGGPSSWWRVLHSMVDRIAALGVTIAYLPPPWRDDSSWQKGDVHGGGEGYFWHDFDLDSRYGTKAELTALVAALRARNIRSIVDLVPNHRDGSRMQRDVWPRPGPCWSWGGGDDGGGFDDGRSDLNLGNPIVHARFREALDELLEDCGVEGWRWDFVWGYSVDHVRRLIQETRKVEYFSMGEYWQGDPNRADDPVIARYGRDDRARLVGWARDAGSCAYDVLLKRAIQTGDAARLRTGLNASRRREDRSVAVTYVDNHDTGPSPWSAANGWGQRHWPCPMEFKSKAYAYVLSMPGTPSVYWPDVFDWGGEEEIRALIAARRRAGIVSDSGWIDLCDAHGGFAGIVQDAAGQDALALSIASTYRGPGVGWSVARERRGEWTVWIRDRVA
ncbi:MAG: alpha-amylase family glycosyl hydrolase [Polyangiales bacterium]